MNFECNKFIHSLKKLKKKKNLREMLSINEHVTSDYKPVLFEVTGTASVLSLIPGSLWQSSGVYYREFRLNKVPGDV